MQQVDTAKIDEQAQKYADALEHTQQGIPRVCYRDQPTLDDQTLLPFDKILATVQADSRSTCIQPVLQIQFDGGSKKTMPIHRVFCSGRIEQSEIGKELAQSVSTTLATGGDCWDSVLARNHHKIV